MATAFLETSEKPPLHQESTEQRPTRTRLHRMITFRGLALFLFGLFLVTGPVPEHSDLFAAVLGYSLLILVTLACVSTVLLGWWLRSHLKFRVTYDLNSSKKPSSYEPVKIFLGITGGTLPPFFSLRVTPRFEHPLPVRAWRIAGKIQNNELMNQEIHLPHRGRWKIQELQSVFRDTFGISQFVWSYSSETLPAITIVPPESASRALPIFTAETTSGVEQTELERTEGDPYDIKRYHPSDGIRRILWKVYAKSGELLSRHPEPSMTPEGLVATCVLAGTPDDELCSLALSHTRDLEAQDYDFFLLCDGGGSSDIAHTSPEAEDLFISTVWESDQPGAPERIAMIDALEKTFAEHRMGVLRRLTFFVSGLRLASPEFQSQAAELLLALHERQLEALWVILEKGEETSFDQASEKTWWKSFLFQEDTKRRGPSTEEITEAITRFSNNCEAYGFPHIITT